MTRMSALTDALKRQLLAYGYHLTDLELRDVAANAVMALDGVEPCEHPLVEVLSTNGRNLEGSIRRCVGCSETWRPSDEVRK
jgi:hypothetical protein